MIQVEVEFFGPVRDFTSERTVTVELEDGTSVADLLAALHARLGQPFSDAVLARETGVKGHIRLFLNGAAVDSRHLRSAILLPVGPCAKAALFVVPVMTGG
jgi:molybdopterin converting factor small subunit